MLLSICIPSYNRGHLAYARVQELLPILNEEVELIISNNGSIKHTKEYEKIKELSCPYLHYHEFEENQLFHGNVQQVIKMSHGNYCLLISDEDSIILENLPLYIELLEAHDNIGVIKAASTKNNFIQENGAYAAGEDAVREFFLAGNYMSGVIYNRNILTNDLIDEFARRYSSLASYRDYPHLMYDGYVLVNGSYIECKVPLIAIGEADELHPSESQKKESELTGASYNKVETRLEQMLGFVILIRDLNIPFMLKCKMLLMSIEKTWYLVDNSYMQYIYESHGYAWEQVRSECKRNMKEIIHASGIKELPLCEDLIDNFIDELQ